MKRKGIKNPVVDSGGVLIGLGHQCCLENSKKLGLSGVEYTLGIYHQQGFFQHYEKGLISSADSRNVIRGKIDEDVADTRTDAARNSSLMNIPTCKLDLLSVLRKDYVICLLSNTNEIRWKWSCGHVFPYKTSRVEDCFERISLSYEMKMAKLDEEIFRKVLDETDSNPKETFFVDDSETNYIAARSLGIFTYAPKADEDWSHLFKWTNKIE